MYQRVAVLVTNRFLNPIFRIYNNNIRIMQKCEFFKPKIYLILYIYMFTLCINIYRDKLNTINEYMLKIKLRQCLLSVIKYECCLA